MKFCGNIICGVLAPLHLGQVVKLAPILESSLPQRSGSCAFFSVAERSSAARTGGGRPSRADLSSLVCFSVRRGRLSCKSSRSVGTCFPRVSQPCSHHRKRRVCLMMARAEKDEHSIEERSEEGNEETPEAGNIGPPITVKKSAFLTSPDFFVQLGIFVLAAGFVDAGFSGDWSRIGVLSKQTEEELQWAAIGVVPLAATLIWSISKRNRKL